MSIFHVEEENKAQSSRVIRDRIISSRRTQSFREGEEFRTAIAAAAAAVNSIESKEQEIKDRTYSNQKKSFSGHSWNRRQSSHEKIREKDKMKGEEFRTAVAAAASAINSIKSREKEIKYPTISNPKQSLSEILEIPLRPKANEDHGAYQPNPTFVDSKTNDKVSITPKNSSSSVDEIQYLGEKSDPKECELKLEESNIWEENQMEKTKERFMKVKAIIFEWEDKKKLKAKKKLIRKEGKLEGKRARALKNFMGKMETIEKISEGARYQNEENRKRKEIRVKEKAKMIKSWGKIHKPMFLCCLR
ncbi:hypothetical protein R6Q59_006722 [Mikania micrantha]